jgi:hypothetical protein
MAGRSGRTIVRITSNFEAVTCFRVDRRSWAKPIENREVAQSIVSSLRVMAFTARKRLAQIYVILQHRAIPNSSDVDAPGSSCRLEQTDRQLVVARVS